jgi:hypothetical protein
MHALDAVARCLSSQKATPYSKAAFPKVACQHHGWLHKARRASLGGRPNLLSSDSTARHERPSEHGANCRMWRLRSRSSDAEQKLSPFASMRRTTRSARSSITPRRSPLAVAMPRAAVACVVISRGGIRPAFGGTRERRRTSSSRRTAPWHHRLVLPWSQNFLRCLRRGAARGAVARSRARSPPAWSRRRRSLQQLRAHPHPLQLALPSPLPPIVRQRRRCSRRGAS